MKPPTTQTHTDTHSCTDLQEYMRVLLKCSYLSLPIFPPDFSMPLSVCNMLFQLFLAMRECSDTSWPDALAGGNEHVCSRFSALGAKCTS